MRQFLDNPMVTTAHFDTCIYQNDIPVGRRHLKPQQFSGSMLGLRELEGSCKCGYHAKHEPMEPTRMNYVRSTQEQLSPN